MPALPMALAPEISAATARGRPIVALESTILAHGLPYPQNLETGRALEAAIREEGAVPATIAVLDGTLKIGLAPADLERVALEPGLLKLSRRDLPFALAMGRSGATTVAATMIAAHLSGVRVFATGGIGGVHRGAESSFDVSADLEELARTPVAVVCAGAKAILDLPKTLEVLETKGVPVIGFGTDELPAFYSRSSGLKLPLRVETPEEAARLLAMQARLGYPGGAVIAVPIPHDAELPAAEIGAAIEDALATSSANGVSGKDVTPFLLSRLVGITQGRSLNANVALVLNNARVAARIAVALAALPA